MAKDLGKEFEWDGFKGPPKFSRDVYGYESAGSEPPKLGKPTGKGEQPTRGGKKW